MRKERKSEPEELTFWQSYSDMMAALLLVFVLIIAVTVIMDKKDLDEEKKRYEALQIELEGERDQIREQQKRIISQQDQIEKIVGIRGEIIAKLKDEFEKTDMAIAIDPEDGSITFDSKLLFDFADDKLKVSGKDFLKEFFPEYFGILMQDGIKEYIAEVIIEGHTDSQGGYISNLNLSQRRALAVAEYCLSDGNGMFTQKELEDLREKVTANGRSYNGIIIKDGIEDAEASRRVEIKFRLTEEEMIKTMSELLENK